MALNVFKMKKWAGLLLIGFLSTMSYMIGSIYYDFLLALVCFGAGLVVSVMLASVLISNPFQKMLEGQGILCLNIDSTGIIRPFVVAVKPPYISGKIGKNKVSDVFNRSTVFSIAGPEKMGKMERIKEGDKMGGFNISISYDEYNEARFGMFHYPVIIYNQQIKSLITKDFLSSVEKDTFAEHGVLYLNRKVEELSSAVRDFGRYVVETLKPASSWYQSKWFIIVIVGLLVLILAMFAPAVIQQIQGFASTAGSGVGKAASSATITPA